MEGLTIFVDCGGSWLKEVRQRGKVEKGKCDYFKWGMTKRVLCPKP